MKCPKCGFNSFEFLDNCKKCGNALTPFKQNLGIRAVVLPSRQASAPPDAGSVPPPNGAPVRCADDFSRESPPDPAEGANESGATLETFSFEEAGEPVEPPPTGNGKGFEEDGFADLLESGGIGGTLSGGSGPATPDDFSSREFEGFAEGFSFEETDTGADHAPPAFPAEFELDAFTFETESASAENTTAKSGPVADEFDTLFDTPEPDRH